MIARRAVIDIGTVTTRVLIADCTLPGQEADACGPEGVAAEACGRLGGACATNVDVLYRNATITELGEGLVQTGRLSGEAIERVLAAVDSYAEKMHEFGLDLAQNDPDAPFAIAMATSAARDASNSEDLVGAMASRNIPLVVIAGEREATLSFTGAVSGILGVSGILVNDIGGGSTELVLGSVSSDGTARIERSHSFDVGCRRVTDMFLHSDPPAASELADARSWIAGELGSFFDGTMGGSAEVRKLVGVAGTATSLVSMCDQMVEYDSSKVHGRTMHLSDVNSTLEQLSSMTLEQRRHVVGLQPERAGVIVAGMLILQVLMQLAGVDELTVSESDNMQGLMLDWPAG